MSNAVSLNKELADFELMLAAPLQPVAFGMLIFQLELLGNAAHAGGMQHGFRNTCGDHGSSAGNQFDLDRQSTQAIVARLKQDGMFDHVFALDSGALTVPWSMGNATELKQELTTERFLAISSASEGVFARVLMHGLLVGSEMQPVGCNSEWLLVSDPDAAMRIKLSWL